MGWSANKSGNKGDRVSFAHDFFLQFFFMVLYFAQECWVPRKPSAEFLPLFVRIRHVAVFLVWSIVLTTGRIAIVVVVVDELSRVRSWRGERRLQPIL